MVLVANHGDEDGAHHDTAVDFHGNPADKSKTGGWLAAGLILGTELSERICVMGISMNLVTYLVGDLHISSAKSATIVTNFLGTLNLLGLLGVSWQMLNLVALYTIALGGGGIKSNVSGFGSDQFDSTDPKEEKAMIFFFNRFYFCISIGSLFAVIVLVYVQDNVGRGWGYGTSAGTMVIAVAILLCGTPWTVSRPQGSL
ncbi:hypothetical protein GH714_018709 [Hevea brasiliensis]|uniref:Uncharacterized protein n=1 Tax=Hevea brasiliensis TaxID=3981 RepID=A0A6A6KTG6_HEVBR|nr:hypothetical protein GH714_018709 [Hevea brasiliensis]